MTLVGNADPATSAPNAGAPVLRFTYRGRGEELFLIWIKNALLTLVTLGIYFPWARAEVLRYTIGHFEADGDPLAFHGHGKELFFGLIRAFGIIGGVTIAVFALTLIPGLQFFATLTLYAALLAISGLAMFGSFRYRLTRTSWRGVRFAFHGDRGEFMKMFVLHALLVAATLGWGAPLFATWRRKQLVSSSAFGTRRFGFDGEGKHLMRPFVLAVVLTLPTLGLAWLWYDARQRRYLWNSTTFDQARFHLDFETRDWVVLQLVNGLLAAFTAGLAWPWIMSRSATFIADHLTLVGPVDLAAIRQEIQTAPATGEALAEVFDVDIGF